MAKHTAISEEEFLAWHDDPVTRWVMEGATKAAAKNKLAWTDGSWATGRADQDALNELRTRADAYLALVETDFEGWRKAHGEEE